MSKPGNDKLQRVTFLLHKVRKGSSGAVFFFLRGIAHTFRHLFTLFLENLKKKKKKYSLLFLGVGIHLDKGLLEVVQEVVKAVRVVEEVGGRVDGLAGGQDSVVYERAIK